MARTTSAAGGGRKRGRGGVGASGTGAASEGEVQSPAEDAPASLSETGASETPAGGSDAIGPSDAGIVTGSDTLPTEAEAVSAAGDAPVASAVEADGAQPGSDTLSGEPEASPAEADVARVGSDTPSGEPEAAPAGTDTAATGAEAGAGDDRSAPGGDASANDEPSHGATAAAASVLASGVASSAAGWAPVSSPAPPPQPPARRGGMMGSVLGGLIAAGIGAGVVLYLLPEGWRAAPGPDTAALEQRLAALESRPAPEPPAPPAAPDLAPLEERIAALEGTPAPSVEAPDPVPLVAPLLAPLQARLDTLEAAVAGIDLADAQPDLTPLQNRIAALEGQSPVDLAPLDARIAALDAALPELVAQAVDEAHAAARAALAAQEAEIAEARARAEVVGALGDLGLAADTGAPAPDTLDRIAAATELPAALAPFREGLPTLAALQAGFPAAARAALAAAPPPEAAGPGDRLMTFLRNQTAARSLAPRAGDDADAVLSRAEAAVRAGDLPAALAEMDSLPAASAAALAGWRARAESRLAALSALNDLSARLGED